MSASKRVVITGATGLIGKQLCAQLRQRGDQIVVFSRNPQRARQAVPGAAEYISWNGKERGDWVGALAGADAVINLAGASIQGRRWDEEYKRELYDSRIIGTQLLVEAIAGLDADLRPGVLVNGSAIGYYGYRDATVLDESAEPGSDFLARLTVDWEHEALKAQTFGVRTATLRTGIVLATEGGALAQLVPPFKVWLGGPVLPGSQYFPWIHIADEVGLVLFALDHPEVRGPLNLSAPEPVTNSDFTNALAKALGVPAIFPIPGFALWVLFGELADSLTHGQRAVPKKAQELGYEFQFPTVQAALNDLLKQ